jgi:uncharacterized protein (DUF3820 family)
MLMPFGKFRGREVAELPASYLAWCWENVPFRSPQLREAIREALCQRLRAEGVLPPPWQQDWLKVVFGRLALEYHPDRRAGSDEGMRVINRLWELLGQMASQDDQAL